MIIFHVFYILFNFISLMLFLCLTYLLLLWSISNFGYFFEWGGGGRRGVGGGGKVEIVNFIYLKMTFGIIMCFYWKMIKSFIMLYIYIYIMCFFIKKWSNLLLCFLYIHLWSYLLYVFFIKIDKIFFFMFLIYLFMKLFII